MEPDDLIQKLKQSLSSSDCQTVISSLRQDRLVWQSLQDPTFLSRVFARSANDLSMWSPAALFIIQMDHPELLLDLLHPSEPQETLQPLAPELRQQSAQEYEKAFTSSRPPVNLVQAGLLALALRERRRVKGTWHGLIEELSSPTDTHALNFSKTWSTPLACLLGLVPDPLESMKGIIPTDDQKVQAGHILAILHAVLSNPLSTEDQVEFITNLLGQRVPPQQLFWLQQMDRIGRSELVSRVAGSLIEKPENAFYFGELKLENVHTNLSGEGPTPVAEEKDCITDPLLLLEPPALIEMTRQLAEFYDYAGNPDRAISLLLDARDMTRRLQARITSQLAISAGSIQEDDVYINTWEQAHDLLPNSTTIQACLATAYLHSNQVDGADKLISSNCDDPSIQLINAKLVASHGDVAQAQAIVKNAREKLGIQSAITLPDTTLRQTRIHPHDRDIIQTLLDLNLIDEALEFTNQLLENQPVNPPIINQAIQVYRKAGQLDRAIQQANIAVCLQPGVVELHKQLAILLEEALTWDQALYERQKVVELSTTPSVDDQLAVARCGIQLKQTEIVLPICQVLLTENPEEGNAHYLNGEALLLAGDFQGAIDHFNQATVMVPEQPEPWLALSNAQAGLGDYQKSLEILRAASLSIPNSPQILAALGEASLANGSPTEALPSLRTAFNINPHSLPVALLLSDTLLLLNRYEEARIAIEKIIHYYPEQPKLAYNYAQSLLAGGEKSKAVPYLFTAAQAPLVDAKAVISLAQTIIDLAGETQKMRNYSQTKAVNTTSPDVAHDLDLVCNLLEQTMSKAPENIEVKMLLAELLQMGNKSAEANELFRKLAESPEARDPENYWRIQFGLGSTALQMDQADTALAALQEAAAANSENTEIQRTLAEAFYKAKLAQESLRTAQIVLKSAPHHLDNLIWFTHLMLDLHFLPEAIQALTKAVELAPTQSDLILLLGTIQYQAGDTTTSKQSLARLKALEDTSASALEKAADLLSQMGEINQTIEYLEAARKKQVSPSFTTLVDLAKIYERSGNLNAAMETVEQAVALRPNDINLCLLQSSLFEKLDRRQAALACLEHILQVINIPPSDNQHGDQDQSNQPTLAEIHFRMASLLRSIGDIHTALGHAEEALNLDPDRLDYRSLAAHLAYSLMDLVRAYRLCQLPESESNSQASGEVNPVDDDLYKVRLLCLKSELGLEKDNPSQDSGELAKAAQLIPDHPRVNGLLARFAKLSGDLQNTEKYFNLAFSSLSQHSTIDNQTTSPQPMITQDPDSSWDLLGTAEAALELQQWQVSITLFQKAIRDLPLEARPRLRFARALVISAETQLSFQALHVKTHAPGDDMLNQDHYDLFEDAYLSANRLCQSTEVIRWHNRGQAVFHPGPQTARSLGNYILGPDDTAALIAAYRRSNQIAEVQKVAQTFFNHTDVLLQLNLALLDTNLEASLAAIQTAIELDVNNPILQAAYAYTVSDDVISARQSIETALSFWPDEAEWHRYAAELCLKSGDILASIAHWQQAVALEPNSYEYNFALGSAYLASGNNQDAIKTLDHAVHVNPFQYEAWYGLAKANLQSGNYAEAMSCAEQTCDLAPNQVEPLLLAGEVSLRLGQYQKTISKSQAVLNLNPQNNAAIMLNTRALSAMGSTQEALDLIDSNLTGPIQPTALLLERIRLIKSLKGIQSALPDLQNLAVKNPNEPEVLALLAQAQAETGQVDAAERTAQTALKLQSNQPAVHLLLGRIQRMKGQLDQSINHLSESVRQDPSQVDAYLELGRAYQDRREHLQALKIYRQATQVAPEDPRPYYQAGLTLRESKDYLAAETMLRHAARLAPDDINIRRQLGAIITLNLVHHPQEASVIQ